MAEDSFKQAKKELPKFIHGFDAFVHRTPNDLAWLVLLQVDLFVEHEESEIKTKKQFQQAKKYVERWISNPERIWQSNRPSKGKRRKNPQRRSRMEGRYHAGLMDEVQKQKYREGQLIRELQKFGYSRKEAAARARAEWEKRGISDVTASVRRIVTSETVYRKPNAQGIVQLYQPTRGIVIEGMKKPPGHPCDAKCKRAGHKYRHRFAESVEVIGMPNGEIRLKSR